MVIVFAMVLRYQVFAENVEKMKDGFVIRRPGGLFSRKPHCVGEHLQCKDGVRRFKRRIVSMGIP
jgi:hypothetical protein